MPHHRGPAPVPPLARRLARGMPLKVSGRGSIELPWGRTVRWDGRCQFRPELVRVGLDLLSRGWEVAVPLDDATRLAESIGTPEDRRRTELVVGDLRVPVYDPRLLLLRRCEASERLLAEYARQAALGGDPRLAFLRALYLSRAVVLALPPNWIAGKQAA